LAETPDNSAESLIRKLCDIRDDRGPKAVRELLKGADLLVVSPDPAKEAAAKKLIDAIRRSAKVPGRDHDPFNLGRRSALRELSLVKCDTHEAQLFRVFPELKTDYSNKHMLIPPARQGDGEGKKPTDRLLGIFFGLMGFVLYLIPEKTPTVVALCVLAMLGLAIHPVWYFWWVEEKLWRRISALGLLCVGLIGFGCFAWPPTVSRPTIALSPMEVTFGRGTAYTFTVKNNTEKDVYTVALKLSFGVSPDDFRIDTPIGSARALAPGPNGLKFTDTSGIECRNKLGNYNIYIFVQRLAAGESREFSLTHISNGTVRVQSRVSHFEEAPQPRITDERGLLTPWMVDEDCDPVHILVFLQ